MLPNCAICSTVLDPILDKKNIKEFCKHCIICRNKKRNKSTRPLCIHKKPKSNCKGCGGNSLCQHFVIKFECKLCNATSTCIHNKRHYYCKHLLQKNKCKECNKFNYCNHNKIISRCKECSWIENVLKK